jgi:hypothetical protein
MRWIIGRTHTLYHGQWVHVQTADVEVPDGRRLFRHEPAHEGEQRPGRDDGGDSGDDGHRLQVRVQGPNDRPTLSTTS